MRYVQGFVINTCEGEKFFTGSIVTVIADNLGSHAVGGFKEGFTALRPCRQCMTSNTDLKIKVKQCYYYY